MGIVNIRGHSLWTAPLIKQSVVVDAGAHQGEFSTAMSETYGCKCYLVEANPNLASRMSDSETRQVISAALTAEDGRGAFYFDANPESGTVFASQDTQVADSGPSATEVEFLSLATLMSRFGLDSIDVLKLDVEGAEFPFLELTPDHVLEKVGQITVEFHDFQKRFAGQGLFEKARLRLEKLGFLCCAMSLRTHGDVLFLNRRRVPLSLPQRVYASLLARPIALARRVLLRKATP